MTLIATPFNALSTADDVVRGVDLTGVRALVTGASSGIGVETAKALARAGAEVVLAVRDERAGWAALAEIVSETGSRRVRGVQLDLADRGTIGRLVDDWRGPLHLLINNAGVMACPLARTREGWERHFATNYLGHFELALGLHEALCRGADARGEARIVSVSSGAHALAAVNFEDPHFERRRYDPWTAYAQSKTAAALFAVEASARWAHDGIVAHAVNPGFAATRLQRYVQPDTRKAWDEMERRGLLRRKTVRQGAATTLVAALAREFARKGGRYLSDCNEAAPMADSSDAAFEPNSVREWARDPQASSLLWEMSLDMVGEPVMSN